MSRFTSTLPAPVAMRHCAVKIMRALLSALMSARNWLQDNLARKLGIRVIPDLLPERTRRHEIKLPLRGYSQLDSYSCGVAAGWSVLQYFRRSAAFREFDTACAPNPKTGTSTRRLSTALCRHGLRVFRLRDLDFDAIQEFLKAGFPLLTIIRQPHWEENTHHWAVIYGFGWRPRRIHIVGRTGTPGFTKWELSWRKFKSLWTGRDESLVCIPEELVPREKRRKSARKSATI